MKKLSIVWLRRNLRVEDNKVIAEALRNSETILPIYVFDIKILSKYPNPTDRRLSFIANILYDLNLEFQKYDGELTVFYGNSTKIVPKLAKLLDVDSVYADEDFEPENIERDEKIKSRLSKGRNLELIVDHLLVRPDLIVKNDGNPFKKITPYIRAYKDHLVDNANDLMAKYTYRLGNRLYNHNFSILDSDLNIININDSPKKILDQVGYKYIKDELWHPRNAKGVLQDFITHKIENYKDNRHLLYVDGTSRLSPYIRFGVLSIRELFYEAYPFRKTAGGDQWYLYLYYSLKKVNN
jgi:deoxyribodipyrimidine photo-lyase